MNCLTLFALWTLSWIDREVGPQTGSELNHAGELQGLFIKAGLCRIETTMFTMFCGVARVGCKEERSPMKKALGEEISGITLYAPSNFWRYEKLYHGMVGEGRKPEVMATFPRFFPNGTCEQNNREAGDPAI